jgi:predicted dinucleotide-binding enzyme
MKIGIIGAGHIGSTLARRFRAEGHDVAIANSRGPESLEQLARETGAHAVTVEEAARGKDVVVVTIPEKAVPALPKHLFADAEHTVVVDTGNYYPEQRDGRIESIEHGLPESRWVEQQIGHPVVKAFNTMVAASLLADGTPAGTPGRLAIPAAADDAQAKAVVMRLIDEIGFDPVDGGTIDESWRQQPGSQAYGRRLDADTTRRALQEARR